MFQRIQSIFLLLVTACQVALLFIPVLTFTAAASPDATIALTGMKFSGTGIAASYAADKPYAYMVSILILISLSVATATSYTNRSRQMRFARFMLIALVLQYIAIGVYFFLVVREGGQLVLSGSFGSILPLICMVLTWMALHRIRKDEDLVRSIDRIR